MAATGPLTALAVAALVAVDIGLVYFALDHVRGDPAEAGAGPTSVATTENDPSGGPKGDEPEGTPADPFGAGPVLLDASGDGALLRATRGDCTGDHDAPAVEVSTDGGQSFTDAGIDDLREVLRVSAETASDLLVVAASDNCRPVAYTSSDGGLSWTASAGTGPYWRLRATDDSTVRSPARVGDPGCDVLALAPLTESGARVLCTTGELRGTANAGTSWVLLGNLPGAVGVYYVDAAAAYALGESQGCPAAVFATSDGGSSWDELTCLDGDEPQAISAAGSVVTAMVDGKVQQSSDGGQTWSAP